jgi:hypothetical protein
MLAMQKRISVLLAALAIACSQEAAKSTVPPPVASIPAPIGAERPVSITFGEPVRAAAVALSDIAKNPRAFEGRTLATSGTVTAVCQNMGCWMEIRDEAGNAHVRMHGHSFFIPKTASGRPARVQATVVPVQDAKSCEDNPSPGSVKGLARVELDATGVELD